MISVRFIRTVFYLLICSFFLLVFIGNAQAQPQWFENIGDRWEEWKKRTEKGIADPLIEWHYYWKDGLHIDSTKKNFRIRLNGRVLVDGGYIGADNELQNAFPNLEGGNVLFRDLRVNMFGALYDWMEFKFSMDFANIRDIKDQWIRFTKISYIGQITLGHMRESFSLERLTSLGNLTFMERALPTEAFTPGRNMGINDQMTR